ncbi:MAG TPA: hypothetical protein VNH11_26265 [Pirellulales bacterium]|nr:hypothetical protein [Pirellulales bacterium]
MNCREFNQVLDELLIEGPEVLDRPEASEHSAQCPSCAWQQARARDVLEAIAPSHRVRASAGLKQRVVSAFPEAEALPKKPAGPGLFVGPYKPEAPARSPGAPGDLSSLARRVGVRAALVLAAAAVVLLAVSLSRHTQSPGPGLAAFSLLSQAAAAEARFFADDHLVQLVNEIVVKPVSDAELAAIRWIPLVSLGPDGKPQSSQLKLAAKPGESYTVRDAAWYDPPTGRFARVLTVDGRPLFAHSFDGQAIYTLSTDDQGGLRVERAAVSDEFRPPKSPAEFLGIAAGLTSVLDRKDRRDLVSDAGRTTLGDGSSARVVKLGFGPIGQADKQVDAFYRVVIRDDDHTIESFEFVVRKESLLVVRRAKSDETGEPSAGWDLAKLKSAAKQGPTPAGLGVLADLVKPNVTVEQMAERADFPVYVFSHAPSWAKERQIMDILDIVSPPHRMFAATYRAQDGRHVVFVQAHTFNEKLGPLVAAGKLVYTSPGGVKVYSGAHDEQAAEILLQSARAVLRDPPAKDRTGYLLTTPDGTHPALAINGRLGDEELHELIDSLEPVRK